LFTLRWLFFDAVVLDLSLTPAGVAALSLFNKCCCITLKHYVHCAVNMVAPMKGKPTSCRIKLLNLLMCVYMISSIYFKLFKMYLKLYKCIFVHNKNCIFKSRHFCSLKCLYCASCCETNIIICFMVTWVNLKQHS